jgi:hypothetical protein
MSVSVLVTAYTAVSYWPIVVLPMSNPLNELSNDEVYVVHHVTAGKYASYRLEDESGFIGQARFKILVTYRNGGNNAGERRIAGGFKTVEDALRYIARFLPELFLAAQRKLPLNAQE